MKIYRVEFTQLVKAPMNKVWDFFSSPANLGRITPAEMNFKIVEMDGDRMFSGQKIRYRVTVMPLVRVTWVTEITEAVENKSFIDEQRKGPYSLWRHRHTFEEAPGGVLMADVVEYAIPFGFIGRIANALFVAREVRRIFAFRFEAVERIFNN